MSLVAPSVKPTAAKPASTTASPAQPQQAPVPFIRATRKQSTLATAFAASAPLSAAQLPYPPIQVRPSGFLARLRLQITATAAGNAAAVAFQPDAPFNVLQNVSFSSPAGDVLLNPIDGFALSMLHKLGAFASALREPLSYPSFTKTTGAVGAGGSFSYEVDIPVEIDSRDAFGAIQNMNAAEQFVLQMTQQTSTLLYSTPPTTLPTINVIATMEYYSQPAQTNGSLQQATAPFGNGTLSIVQSQTVQVNPGTTGRIQIVNTGTVLRGLIFILRTAAGVRTDADWPAITSLYLNNQQLLYKPYQILRNQMNEEYKMIGAPGAVPVAFAPDNGVFVFTDFMNFGGQGGMNVDGASNRNQWLPTGKGTDLELEATTAWGGSAASLQIITLGVRPINAQALYSEEVY